MSPDVGDDRNFRALHYTTHCGAAQIAGLLIARGGEIDPVEDRRAVLFRPLTTDAPYENVPMLNEAVALPKVALAQSPSSLRPRSRAIATLSEKLRYRITATGVLGSGRPPRSLGAVTRNGPDSVRILSELKRLSHSSRDGLFRADRCGRLKGSAKHLGVRASYRSFDVARMLSPAMLRFGWSSVSHHDQRPRNHMGQAGALLQ